MIIKIGKVLIACRVSYDKKKANNSKLGYLSYCCNICGQYCEMEMSNLKREEPSCPSCSSTVRTRSIIHVLSVELFGESLIISDFPERPDLRGIGMSDWKGYAIPLTNKMSYKNTYYHKEPILDITSIDPSLEGTLDFIISSEIFEHISPPVSRAFCNARKLLKPDGVLIFTVPYLRKGKTKEHYPDLYKYEVIEKRGKKILKNITSGGIEQKFDNLVFHGGVGSTLEIRSFTESSLIEEFRKAGFDNLKIYNEPFFEYGIYEGQKGSFPIAARIR